MTTQSVAPNTIDGAAQQHNAIPGLDAIANKMAAMRQEAERNRLTAIQPDATGTSDQANTDEPVAAEATAEEPEVAVAPDTVDAGTEDISAQDSEQEPVSEEASADTSAQEIIDFIEFAESNPNAKFKFMRNGKEVIIDAKRAAAILGQGGAIHEEARKLKIERSEWDEYIRDQRARQEGLTLAMEFTVEPRLQQAYDEIVRTQGYQTTFAQQLQSTQDAAEQARIRASMEQNERYIAQQGAVINQLKPAVDQFRQIRQQQVAEVLESNRKQFKDKELRNSYVYDELREKISRQWPQSQHELIPGIKNLDLIASDETILGLIRDGLKFRDRPAAKQAGASIAALTRGKTTGATARNSDDNIQKLREQAKGGDKKAADNLLVAQLARLRASRAGR